MVEHIALKTRLWSIVSAGNLHQRRDFPIKVGCPFSFYTVWRIVGRAFIQAYFVAWLVFSVTVTFPRAMSCSINALIVPYA